LECLVKEVVGSRTRPSPSIPKKSAPLLKSFNHDDFKGVIFPAIQKALLRNPEVVMECVAEVFAAVSIDVSSYAGDLAKTLAACLHAKEDRVRDDAVLVCDSLSRQCSDPGSLEKMINTFFAVYNGSEGKLTVVAHKISLMQVIDGGTFNELQTQTSAIKSPIYCPQTLFDLISNLSPALSIT
jgi:hypothetical protein